MEQAGPRLSRYSQRVIISVSRYYCLAGLPNRRGCKSVRIGAIRMGASSHGQISRGAPAGPFASGRCVGLPTARRTARWCAAPRRYPGHAGALAIPPLLGRLGGVTDRDARARHRIDGKTARRSGGKRKALAPTHMVSARAARLWLVLGQLKGAEKSNEIVSIPKVSVARRPPCGSPANFAGMPRHNDGNGHARHKRAPRSEHSYKCAYGRSHTSNSKWLID